VLETKPGYYSGTSSILGGLLLSDEEAAVWEIGNAVVLAKRTNEECTLALCFQIIVRRRWLEIAMGDEEIA
jgi:hypothetical protein